MTAEQLERALADIVTRLRQEYQPEKIILFGSYATGTADDDSDVDLLIIKRTDKRFIERWTEVQRVLGKRKRYFGLDTFVLTPDELEKCLGEGDQFVEQILSDGRVLYAA